MNNTQVTHPFPQTISAFQFSRILETEQQSSAFQFAVYLDKSGTEYICKLWNGAKDSLKRTWIKNEIYAYKLLHTLIKKHPVSKTNRFSNIFIPRLHLSVHSKRKVLFLMDKINGASLHFHSSKRIIHTYELLFQYLKELSSRMRSNNSKILQRSPIQYLFLYHYYAVITILKFPFLLNIVINNYFKVLKGMLHFVLDSKEKDQLVLRDLASNNNIFVRNRSIYILDLESLVFTKSIIQIASFIIVESSNIRFLDEFLYSKLLLPYKKSKRKRSILKALLMHGALVEINADTGISLTQRIADAKKILAYSERI